VSGAAPARRFDRYLKAVAASSLVNSGTSALATACLLPFVIKKIGLETYGLWAVLTIFIGISSALDFGIWKSLVYLIPRQRHSRDQLLSSAIALCLLAGLVFTAAFGVLLAAGLPLFGAVIERQGNLPWWLYINGCIIVFASLITNLARALLEVDYRGYWVNLGYALLTLLMYGVAAGIAQFTRDPRVLIAGSTGVYVVILFAHIAAVGPSSIRLEMPGREAVMSIIRYGGSFFIADAPSILLGPLILYLFVLMAKDSGEYGVFDIALRVATLAATTLSMLSAPFFAMFAASDANDRHGVRLIMNRHLRITLLLGAAIWVGYWVVGKPVVAAFFLERPDEIYRASLIMLLGTVAAAAFEPVTRMLMGIGKLRRLAAIRFAMTGSALISVALLVNLHPLDRFAVSCAVGFSVAAIGLFFSDRAEAHRSPVPQ
jgi:O-antigen/teichoic acid export membrane protein